MKRLLAAASLAVWSLCGCGAPSPAEELCLSATESPLVTCPGPVTVPGIDVSYYQGTINWTAVKNAGQRFAITRVSDGATYSDSQFTANWRGIRQAGLVRGVYQFFRPGQDPTTQANLLLSRVRAAGGFAADDLPVVMDIEASDGQSAATVQAHMRTWLAAIESATGKRPIIYTANFMSGVVGTGFARYPLWVANYGAVCPLMPSGWSKWIMWQWSSTGSVAGISGHVDVNKWNGTLSALVDYVTPNVPPPPHDAGTPTPDAGTPRPDAGTPRPDAGAPRSDGGAAQPDSGSSADAGATDPVNPVDLDGGLPPDEFPADGADGGFEGATLGSGHVEWLQQCSGSTAP